MAAANNAQVTMPSPWTSPRRGPFVSHALFYIRYLLVLQYCLIHLSKLMLRIHRSFQTLVHDSTIARFTVAMLGSIFVTCATFLPLLLLVARFANGAPTSTSHITPLLDGYPMPELCLGNCTSIHDPSIVYEEGLYWRFTTQHGINIANAPSLRGPWTYRGALLTNGTKIKLYEKQEVWVGLGDLTAVCFH